MQLVSMLLVHSMSGMLETVEVPKTTQLIFQTCIATSQKLRVFWDQAGKPIWGLHVLYGNHAAIRQSMVQFPYWNWKGQILFSEKCMEIPFCIFCFPVILFCFVLRVPITNTGPEAKVSTTKVEGSDLLDFASVVLGRRSRIGKETEKITLLRVIPTMTFIHFVTGKSSGILSDISSGILSGILSGISSGILSGISSGILSTQIFWHSIWQTFWHFICHIFWHSIWHFIWHSIWHSIWHIF